MRNLLSFHLSVCPQDLPNQIEAGQEAEAESSDSAVDQDEDREHDPVQRQAQALEEDQAQAVNLLLLVQSWNRLMDRPICSMLM